MRVHSLGRKEIVAKNTFVLSQALSKFSFWFILSLLCNESIQWKTTTRLPFVVVQLFHVVNLSNSTPTPKSNGALAQYQIGEQPSSLSVLFAHNPPIPHITRISSQLVAVYTISIDWLHTDEPKLSRGFAARSRTLEPVLALAVARESPIRVPDATRARAVSCCCRTYGDNLPLSTEPQVDVLFLPHCLR